MSDTINKYFSGVPPSGADILSWYIDTAATITGIHIQVQQPPGSTATFRIGTSTAGGGSGFNVTIAAGALEGISTSQTVEVASGSYIYLYATTPAGSGDINAELIIDRGPYTSTEATLVTQAEAQAYCELPSGQWTDEMDIIHQSVEKAIEDYCRRTFADATYNERHNGHGKPYLFLKQYPVIDLLRVSIGTRTAIFLKNSNEHVTANVSVTSTGLRLTYQGTTDSTVTWTSNDTLSDIVTAINALGSGWSARLATSSYGTFKSEELWAVGRQGMSAADNNQVQLEIPERAEDGVYPYLDEGYIYRPGGWPRGSRNVFVRYLAGYETIPLDLQLAVKICIKAAWQKRDEETHGLKSMSVAGVSQSFLEEWAPPEAMAIINRYRRPLA